VCPYPQVEARKAIQGLESGEWLVRETDHVPSTGDVPKAVPEQPDAEAWQSSDGFYRVFLNRR